MNKNDFYLWKILGIIPQEQYEQKDLLKLICPNHEDNQASFELSKKNHKEGNQDYFSGYCFSCPENNKPKNVAAYWLANFTERNHSDNQSWKVARTMFSNISDMFGDTLHNISDMRTNNDPNLIKSDKYEDIREAVLKILDQEILDNLNDGWENELHNLVDLGEIWVEKADKFADFKLTFRVGFGMDHGLGSIKYQPGETNKVVSRVGTPTGIMMPFYFKDNVENKNNPNLTYKSSLLSNNNPVLFIVEGQKDMLVMRLLGLPAVTLTGGAAANIKYPEMLMDKNIIIIYDNDDAGEKGAEKLAMSLINYAKSIVIGNGIFHDMENKEDITDFFFKYKHKKADLLSRLANKENTILYTRELLKQKQKELERQSYADRIKRNSKGEIEFKEVYDMPVHQLYTLDAMIDDPAVESAHSMYTKVNYNFFDHRPDDEIEEFNINDEIEALKEGIDEWNKTFFDKYGYNKYSLEMFTGNVKGFRIIGTIGEQDFDIVEKVLLDTDRETSFSYKSIFRELERSLENFKKRVDRRWDSHKKAIEASPDGDVSGMPEHFFTRKKDVDAVLMPYIDYDQESVIDFKKFRIYEDKSVSKTIENNGSVTTTALYDVYVQSSHVKDSTKIGDRITLQITKGRAKRQNKPYLLAWWMDYRDEIDNFETDNEAIRETLDKFKLKDGETIDKHMLVEYFKFRYHTGNKGKTSRNMWEIADLTYNSIARYTYDYLNGSKDKVNSTLDVMLVGDSRTGKTAITDELKRMYALGAKVEFENITSTALIGGTDMKKQNSTTLGFLPLNHRKLAVLEELSARKNVDYRTDMFLKLMELRMSGIANIERVSGKIEQDADVRIITNSNAVGGSPMRAFKGSTYWNAVYQLLPNVAILNRFTLVYMATTEDVDKDVEFYTNEKINQYLEQAKVDTNTLDDYRTKIQWIWSRSPENVVIDAKMSDYVEGQILQRLEPKYAPRGGMEIGIFTKGTTAKHIINIGLAIAAHLVSTDATYKNVILKKEHIDYAIDLYERYYGDWTGIPAEVQRKRNDAKTSRDDVLKLTGDLFDDHVANWLRSGALTLNKANNEALRNAVWGVYKQLYGFSLKEGGTDGAVEINWLSLEDQFQTIMSSINHILDNGVEIGSDNPLLTHWAKFGITPMMTKMQNTRDIKAVFKNLWNSIGMISDDIKRPSIFRLNIKFNTGIYPELEYYMLNDKLMEDK